MVTRATHKTDELFSMQIRRPWDMFHRAFGQELQLVDSFWAGIRQSKNHSATLIENLFDHIPHRITSRQRKYLVLGCL